MINWPSMAEVWTDVLGRTYEYHPHEAEPIAETEVVLGGEAVLAVTAAAAAMQRIPQLPVGGVATVLYRSEASASSLIEGIGPGVRRVLEAEFAAINELDDEAAFRVVSNYEALQDAISTPIPPSEDDLLRWHRTLLNADRRLGTEFVGAFRTTQNWIGGDATGPRRAVFVPPRPTELSWLIDDLLQFCARTDITPVVHAAIAHARFEVIHPFVDGNGRVGRMLLQQLLSRGAPAKTPVPTSVVWSRDPDRYIAGLRQFQEGNVEAWLTGAGSAIVEAVSWMNRTSQDVASLLDDFRNRITTRGESVAQRVINDLPDHPIVDAVTVSDRYGVAPQTAHHALQRLEGAGILVERGMSRRRKGRPRRVFTAPDLIDLLSVI